VRGAAAVKRDGLAPHSVVNPSRSPKRDAFYPYSGNKASQLTDARPAPSLPYPAAVRRRHH